MPTLPGLFFYFFVLQRLLFFLGFSFFVQPNAGKFFQHCCNSHPTIRVYALNSRITPYRTHFLRRNRTLTLESVCAHNEEKVGVPSLAYLYCRQCYQRLYLLKGWKCREVPIYRCDGELPAYNQRPLLFRTSFRSRTS